MSCRFYSFGLETLEDEELLKRFVQDTIETGRVFWGYDRFHIHRTYGDLELSLSCILNEEEKRIDIERIDTHCQGRCVWHTKYIGSAGEASDGQPRIMVSDYKTSSGIAVVHLVNEGVLPCLIYGEKVVMQIIGLAEKVEYFESEEAFHESLPTPKYGPHILPATDTVMATRIFDEREPEESYEEYNERQSINLVVGTVKELYYGRFQIKEDVEPERTFIRCIVDTQLGELEIDHSIDQVPESERELIKVGAVLVATVNLSGDVSIYQYDDGRVRDEEHDLRVLEEAFIKGDTRKMATIISDDCLYRSEISNTVKLGKEEVLGYIEYVHNKTSLKYDAQLATIYALPDTSEARNYRIGKRAIVLSNETSVRESLVLIDYDEKGNIMSILLTADPRYVVIEDWPAPLGETAEDLFESVEPQPIETITKARATLMNLLDYDEEDEIGFVEDETGEEIRVFLEKVKIAADRPCLTVEELEDHYKELFREVLGSAYGIDDPEFTRMGESFYRDVRFRFSSADFKEEDFQWELAKVLCLFTRMGELRRNKEESDESH